MNLDSFYQLRTEFTLIGLTGRVGSGCSTIAKLLSNPDYPSDLGEPELANLHPEAVKYKICYNYLKAADNWKPFEVIIYKDVILLHVLFYVFKQSQGDSINQELVKIITQNGPTGRKEKNNRFDFENEKDKLFLEDTLVPFLNEQLSYLNTIKQNLEPTKFSSLLEFLTIRPAQGREIFFKDRYKKFCNAFFDLLNNHSVVKRSRLISDLANNLRMTGSVILTKEYDFTQKGLPHIYTNAETINRLIKGYRNNRKGGTRIVIDALKNSLELMYFKEKYSAFYMIATNQDDIIREENLKKTVKKYVPEGELLDKVAQLISLDEKEYRANDFKDGNFASSDVENCIQKSDYHIYISQSKSLPLEKWNLADRDQTDFYFSLNYQLTKLLALIRQPGIITPSTNEHFMQIAYNAKFNSGCISRQVGAVVTDENYSIKAIGWNDVPEGQTPCSMRNIGELIDEKVRPGPMFTEFERDGHYKNGDSFRKLATQVVPQNWQDNLNGRNCSFCFKSFHNAFEDDKNQVHTRSLHAEENAMIQITKFGGQGIWGGNLYTTASPCELCSKKAFQLGIRNIYYIDPYPGIAMRQILKAASQENVKNPNLIMFQGAVGRAFNKLYEPFMAYKDELAILTGINPKAKFEDRLEKILDDDVLTELRRKISGATDKIQKEKLIAVIKRGLQESSE